MKFQIIFKNGRDVIFEAKDCLIEKDFMGETSVVTFKEPKGTHPVWFRLEDVSAIILIEEEENVNIVTIPKPIVEELAERHDFSNLLRKEPRRHVNERGDI